MLPLQLQKNLKYDQLLALCKNENIIMNRKTTYEVIAENQWNVLSSIFEQYLSTMPGDV